MSSNPWHKHLAKTRAANPTLTGPRLFKHASSTYNKKTMKKKHTGRGMRKTTRREISCARNDNADDCGTQNICRWTGRSCRARKFIRLVSGLGDADILTHFRIPIAQARPLWNEAIDNAHFQESTRHKDVVIYINELPDRVKALVTFTRLFKKNAFTTANKIEVISHRRVDRLVQGDVHPRIEALVRNYGERLLDAASVLRLIPLVNLICARALEKLFDTLKPMPSTVVTNMPPGSVSWQQPSGRGKKVISTTSSVFTSFPAAQWRFESHMYTQILLYYRTLVLPIKAKDYGSLVWSPDSTMLVACEKRYHLPPMYEDNLGLNGVYIEEIPLDKYTWSPGNLVRGADAWSPDLSMLATVQTAVTNEMGDYGIEELHEWRLHLSHMSTGKSTVISYDNDNITHRHNGPPNNCISWCANNKRLFLQYWSVLYMVDITNGLSQQLYSHLIEEDADEVLQSAKWSPTDPETYALLISRYDDNEADIVLYNSKSGKKRIFTINGSDKVDEIYPESTQMPNYMTWSPDGTKLSVATNGELTIVDVTSDKIQKTAVLDILDGLHSNYPMYLGIAWSPDGRRIAVETRSPDVSFRVFSLTKAERSGPAPSSTKSIIGRGSSKKRPSKKRLKK